MTKKDDMMPVYLVLGGVMFILVLLLAGNLAFYQMYGLDGIQRAFDDMMRFRFHIGFLSEILRGRRFPVCDRCPAHIWG